MSTYKVTRGKVYTKYNGNICIKLSEKSLKKKHDKC